MAKKTPNFQHSDKENLFALISKYQKVIENKATDAATTKMKSDCWETVTEEFNTSVGGVRRDSK